jgi:hypothetical protein
VEEPRQAAEEPAPTRDGRVLCAASCWMRGCWCGTRYSLAYTEIRRRPLQLAYLLRLLESDLPAVILVYRHYFQLDNLRGYSRALSYVWQLSIAIIQKSTYVTLCRSLCVTSTRTPNDPNSPRQHPPIGRVRSTQGRALACWSAASNASAQ